MNKKELIKLKQSLWFRKDRELIQEVIDYLDMSLLKKIYYIINR